MTATPLHFDKKIGIGAGGVVLVGDHLYGATPQGLLAIAWPTGAIVWQNRSIGAAAVAFADSRLYLRGENGEVALVEATPSDTASGAGSRPPVHPIAARPRPGRIP